MEPRYDIKEVEARINKKWEDGGFANPDVCIEKGFTAPDAEPFSIVLPPPNVTGVLHIGHAFEDTLQDIAVRHARMKGKRTLWIPGTDHAAIATQSKVEKDISKKEGKSRHDLGREEFLRRVREFAQESHDTIVRQVKRLGSSLDWSHEAYTLDEKRSRGVRLTFETMYDLGLIYRGNRIVNWDPKGQTTISDDEMVYVEEKTTFYYFQYGPFVIGTSRPETKFGDKYVVMHPDDKRYASYKHGQHISLEWINGPITATIIKDKAIDMAFGTGVMTITPWHSTVDFEIAERHKLDVEQIIDDRGKLLPIAGEFAGENIVKARPLIVEKLRSKGLLVKEEPYTHEVPTAERTGAIVEPQIKKQWFVAVDKPFKQGVFKKTTLKKLMHDAVSSGRVRIQPERFEKIYFNWINNLRDWCISRQIWFGHRIPVWYCAACGEPHVNMRVLSKLFFMRHGQTDGNKNLVTHGTTNTPLNDTGREQAAAAAETLRNEHIDVIVSSPLARAKETAEIVAKATGAPIVLDEHFQERDFGIAEGMPLVDRNEKYGKPHLTYEGMFEGGEAYNVLEVRVNEALQRARSVHGGKNILIVSHGGVMRMLQKAIRNMQFEQTLELESIPNAHILRFDVGAPCKKCGGDIYEQDPDTLDTWFSSALWPFSTLGWPEQTKDLATYFPNALMAPGYEILFLWVARMILMSGVLLGQVPFKNVLIHGIVRDSKGQKFSKSLGNGIDPLVLADTYGADALRMGLIVGSAPGNDVKFDEQRVKGYRNFATKIWNIARFIEMNKPEGAHKANIAGRPELAELKELKRDVGTHIETYEFHLASEKLYHYIWHTLADKLVEQEKAKLKDGSPAEKAESHLLLETLLLDSLKMLHPFMPFITEEIYGIFRPGKTLMVEKW